MQRELEALQGKLRTLTMTKTLGDSERVVIQAPTQTLLSTPPPILPELVLGSPPAVLSVGSPPRLVQR
jgi:hypothetical protein